MMSPGTPQAVRPPSSIAVVVPSYQRPEHLERCLAALLAQERPADEVVVVVRPDDVASCQVAAGLPAPVRIVHVGAPGLLAAMTVGARATTADVVAFTDDDAEPPPGWTAALLEPYADPRVGGVGGRDVVVGQDPRPGVPVGRINRWGRLTGNHSVGAGAPRDVDVLKGVNMSYRRQALALPTGYRGERTQIHTEVAIGQWARAAGWVLRYDPAITVVHHEAPRGTADDRARSAAAVAGPVGYNLVGGILASRPELFWRRAAYGLLVGDRGTPGVLRAVVSLLQRRPADARALRPSLAGQLAALRDVRRGGGVVLVPLEPGGEPGQPRATSATTSRMRWAKRSSE